MLFSLSLAPRQEIEIKQKLSLKLMCGLCGGDLKDKNENLISVVLFGSTHYGACPICYAEIPKNLQKERGFRNRWTRALKQKMGIPPGKRLKRHDFLGYFGISK